MFFRLDNCEKGFYTVYKDLRQFKSLDNKNSHPVILFKKSNKRSTLSQGQNIPRPKF